MTSRKSSGSIPVESAVDPTRSQNITVSWRRSASGAAATAAGREHGDGADNRRQGDRRGGRRKCRRRGVAGLEEGRADKGEPLSALVDRQALDDQLVADIIERLVVEPEFLAQPPIADPLLQAQQACDEGQGLRETCDGLPPAEIASSLRSSQ